MATLTLEVAPGDLRSFGKFEATPFPMRAGLVEFEHLLVVHNRTPHKLTVPSLSLRRAKLGF